MEGIGIGDARIVSDHFPAGGSKRDGGGRGKTGREKLGIDPTAEDYEDTNIDVLGHTKDSIVYSVDVEWGAMTFRYENSAWDATAHKTVTGAGWKVYDSVNDKVLASETEAVNRIAVTNHSNADTQFDAGHSLERLRWPS